MHSFISRCFIINATANYNPIKVVARQLGRAFKKDQHPCKHLIQMCLACRRLRALQPLHARRARSVSLRSGDLLEYARPGSTKRRGDPCGCERERSGSMQLAVPSTLAEMKGMSAECTSRVSAPPQGHEGARWSAWSRKHGPRLRALEAKHEACPWMISGIAPPRALAATGKQHRWNIHEKKLLARSCSPE